MGSAEVHGGEAIIRRIAAFAVAMLLASPFARADEKKDDSIPGFGLGVGVGIGNAYSGGSPATPPVSVYATVNLGESFRLEPNLGYWYIGKGASAASIVTGAVEPNGGYAVQVGLGGFYVVRPLRPLAIYGGARIGMIFSGTSATLLDQTSVSASASDLYVSPTLGIEWSIVRAFSVGAEAQMAFRWYFDPTITGGRTERHLLSQQVRHGTRGRPLPAHLHLT
jgi:hypothetical protein